MSLAANGHTSFVLSDMATGFPVTADRRGTVEFDTPAGGRISVLGIRFSPPNNALTTIPALANVGDRRRKRRAPGFGRRRLTNSLRADQYGKQSGVGHPQFFRGSIGSSLCPCHFHSRKATSRT